MAANFIEPENLDAKDTLEENEELNEFDTEDSTLDVEQTDVEDNDISLTATAGDIEADPALKEGLNDIQMG